MKRKNMMKSNKKCFAKKMAALAMAGVVFSQICSMDSSAASKGWRLVRTNGPSSEWVTSDIKTFTMTKSTVKITCENISAGAEVHASTSNGSIHGHLQRIGSALSGPAAVGKKISATLQYEDTGSGANRPSGKINY